MRSIALRSFRERGYDATTIRAIAQEAGMSVGATHYHFLSKNHLVHELHLDVQERHRDAAVARVTGSRDLVDRLEIAFATGLDQSMPHAEHASEFLSAAASPRSGLNPLSPGSTQAREITVSVFREAVDSADHHVPADIARLLPDALFFAHLLLTLFWTYDSSEEKTRTRRLLHTALRLVRLPLPFSRVRIVRGPLREALTLVTGLVR